MSDSPDKRRWFLKVSDETVYGSVTTRTLIFWAEQGGIHPGYAVSLDREHWVEAGRVPELAMQWCVVAPDGQIYGPLNRVAAERFLAEKRFPEGSSLRARDSLGEEDFRLPEFPADWVYPSDAAVIGHDAFLAGWQELRVRNVELEAAKAALEAQVAELGATAARLDEAFSVERNRAAELQHAFQEQLERATLLDREHEERRRALQREHPAPKAVPTDMTALYTVLAQENRLLEEFAEQELKLIEDLRKLALARRQQYADRVQAIRRITGESPDEMTRRALRESRPAAASASRMDYQQLAREAQERETELLRRIQALETREVHLRRQLDQAQAHAGSTTELQERLQEMEQRLEQELVGRQHDRRDADHIQTRLLSRIEDLERRNAPGSRL